MVLRSDPASLTREARRASLVLRTVQPDMSVFLHMRSVRLCVISTVTSSVARYRLHSRLCRFVVASRGLLDQGPSGVPGLGQHAPFAIARRYKTPVRRVRGADTTWSGRRVRRVNRALSTPTIDRTRTVVCCTGLAQDIRSQVQVCARCVRAQRRRRVRTDVTRERSVRSPPLRLSRVHGVLPLSPLAPRAEKVSYA